MKDFKFSSPTTLYVGDEMVMKKAPLFKAFGERCYIITSKFPPGVRHLSLEDAIKAGESQNIAYEVFDDAKENPPVETCAELVDRVMAFHPDFLITCGGGSAIDTTKAVNILMKHHGEDPYQVLYGGPSPDTVGVGGEGAVPMVAIPTTAGTGSEISCYSVLTRTDLDTKEGIHPKIFPDVAILDAKYIKNAPPSLIHSGAIDALAHGIEAYLNTECSPIVAGLAETGFGLFRRYKDHLLQNAMTDDDFTTAFIASNVFGMCMQGGTTLPHGMGYPLSHFKHVPHGLACGVFLGEYIRAFKDKSLPEPVVRLCGFDSTDAFADYINQILAADCRFTVTEEEIEAWTDEMFRLKARLNKHPEEITREEIKNIYQRSLANCIVR